MKKNEWGRVRVGDGRNSFACDQRNILRSNCSCDCLILQINWPQRHFKSKYCIFSPFLSHFNISSSICVMRPGWLGVCVRGRGRKGGRGGGGEPRSRPIDIFNSSPRGTHSIFKLGNTIVSLGQVVDGVAVFVACFQEHPHIIYVVLDGRFHAFRGVRHHCRQKACKEMVTSAASSLYLLFTTVQCNWFKSQ